MDSITRSRKSREYGFGIIPSEIESMRQTRSLTNPWESFLIQPERKML
jgi:hypothetical protein